MNRRVIRVGRTRTANGNMRRRVALCRGRPAHGLLVSGVIVVLCLVLSASAPASFPGENGMLAIGGASLWLTCSWPTIHVMRADGSGVRRLSPIGRCARFRNDDGRWAP